ncbi:coiled-coil-helix-coiled-coil-helix domain-containing protein 7 isoform X2 [Protopterus annectens]|uniref:coiled-coil-helix-coiled-coil-helix domain-containing protein 7 isoform X2 n=1 Tax=Protopterus annectens TaxID=7888 RepID=UPI001CF9EC59|nr:coiled-coil-helix-coiled-coil-helix domain-containing protein 7 isoform X2 [Protopterus annectens]XP_043921492.1 coiled-coil-helix-coiled-coil-helix domain-containing protein 7 isoform X2 [Protopterus annectens]XP_043921493.1 coiled-coil-helix-coiled-coil-helix domain-containing protein 7 isoform X2 [Protopterus annectens]
MSNNMRHSRSRDNNPCLQESEASRKCMDENLYNRDACSYYFLKYKKCRKFWHEIMIQRRVDGVNPNMPPAEERKRILESLESMPY